MVPPFFLSQHPNVRPTPFPFTRHNFSKPVHRGLVMARRFATYKFSKQLDHRFAPLSRGRKQPSHRYVPKSHWHFLHGAHATSHLRHPATPAPPPPPPIPSRQRFV